MKLLAAFYSVILIFWGSHQVTAQESLSDLLSNSSCTVPCLLGIQPVVTTRSQLEAILLENNLSYEVVHIASLKMDIYTFVYQHPLLFEDVGVYIGPGDFVEEVNFLTQNLTVQDVLNTYGAPTRVGTVGSYILIYPDLGLVFFASNDNGDNIGLIKMNSVAGIKRLYLTDYVSELTNCPDEPANLCQIATATPTAVTNISEDVSIEGNLSSLDLNNDSNSVSATINDIALNSSGEWIAQAFDDGLIQVQDLASGLSVFEFHSDSAFATKVVWHPQDEHILAASIERDVYVWNVETQDLLGVYRVGGDNREVITEAGSVVDVVTSIAWSPDGTKLAAVSEIDILHVWNVENGVSIHEITLRNAHALAWVNTMILGVTLQFQMELVDVTNGNHYRFAPTRALGNFPSSIDIYNDKILIGTFANEVSVWDLSTGELIHYLYFYEEDPQNHQINPTDAINDVLWSPDARYFASAGEDGIVRIWETEPLRLITTIQTDHALNALAWNPDGSALFYAGDGYHILPMPEAE